MTGICTSFSLLAESLSLLDGVQELLTELLQILVRRQVQSVETEEVRDEDEM